MVFPWSLPIGHFCQRVVAARHHLLACSVSSLHACASTSLFTTACRSNKPGNTPPSKLQPARVDRCRRRAQVDLSQQILNPADDKQPAENPIRVTSARPTCSVMSRQKTNPTQSLDERLKVKFLREPPPPPPSPSSTLSADLLLGD